MIYIWVIFNTEFNLFKHQMIFWSRVQFELTGDSDLTWVVELGCDVSRDVEGPLIASISEVGVEKLRRFDVPADPW